MKVTYKVISEQVSGQTTIQEAKNVAKRLLQQFDQKQQGALFKDDMQMILENVYQNIGTECIPTQVDEYQYFRILDRDNDQKVTLQDLEDVCIRYLCSQKDIDSYNIRKQYGNQTENLKNSNDSNCNCQEHRNVSKYNHQYIYPYRSSFVINNNDNDNNENYIINREYDQNYVKKQNYDFDNNNNNNNNYYQYSTNVTLQTSNSSNNINNNLYQSSFNNSLRNSMISMSKQSQYINQNLGDQDYY